MASTYQALQRSFSTPSATPGPSISTSATSMAEDAMAEDAMAEDDAMAKDAEPTIKFTTIKELHNQVSLTPGDILVVTDVSPEVYTSLLGKNERFCHIRLRRYYADSELLIVTIPTELHEMLHTTIANKFQAKLVRQNLEDYWASVNATTFRRQGHPRGDGGEGDSCGRPFPIPAGRTRWPTLVIEAGDSESLRRLRQDMRWWFDASDHEVKIVLLAKFDHRRRQILLEKYEEAWQTRPGASMTRAALTQANPTNQILTPIRRQAISISRNTTTNPPTYNVTRGTLSLSFRLLFLRDPDPAQGEGDFIWTIAEMEQYAEMVWDSVV